ncbi:MAG: ATP synthase F1 subunit delta [Dehalococcoidia bacterium]
MAGATGRRYAQAAFELALENEGVDRWQEDLARVAQILDNQDFLALLDAPQVPEKVKLDGITTLLPDVAPLIRNMVKLLVLHGRIRVFPGIVEHFGELADEKNGIARAEVVTAVPLDDARRDRVISDLSDMVGKKVEIVERVDPGILGGIVARVGDRLIDGSVRTRLRSLRRELADRPMEVAVA